MRSPISPVQPFSMGKYTDFQNPFQIFGMIFFVDVILKKVCYPFLILSSSALEFFCIFVCL